LIEALATTPALAEVFSDQSVLQAMLDFEAGLARAQAGLEIIPKRAADAITALAQAKNFDTDELATAIFRAGVPAIPMVRMLTEAVRGKDPEAARFVHWGATSQDVSDTAMSLLLKRAELTIRSDLERLKTALADLTERHKGTVMVGRTLLQAAPPVTFGLKAAGWLASIGRGKRRLDRGFEGATTLQLGGASGTLAALGSRGDAVIATLEKELGLNPSPASWHTHRDPLAELICACGILTGSLGKMARDISLLMQSEVAEANESGDNARGGSSTMPNKRNPVACSLTLAAAQRVPGLVASFLSGMIQEHERSVGGWQAEWPVVAAVVQSCGVAVASMAEAAEGLFVDVDRMRSNIENTQGLIFAERAMMALGSKLGRDAAHRIVESAAKRSAGEGKKLKVILAETPEVTAHLTAAELDQLDSPEAYLGSAETFRQALVAESDPKSKKES
jgi:3-carboxy-cis,cis-muconate cycloisomerase